MLSGYTASKEAVEAVGDIAKDMRQRATSNPGSFFWSMFPMPEDVQNFFKYARLGKLR